jgi:glucan phosphoethanolaminetransferase (alkaline phosphatase superfamily)
MDKKLKRSLSIVLGGYLSSVGFYLIWYFTKWRFSFYAMHSRDADILEIIAVVFTITILYFLSLLLIGSIRSLQKFWKSFSIVFIITLLTIFLIPSTYYSIYYKTNGHGLNLTQDKTIEPIDENEGERKNPAVNIKEIRKQLEDAKAKIQAEKNRKNEIEAKLNS